MSRGPTDSGPAAAAKTRSRPSIRPQGQVREAVVGAGRRSGIGVRPDRPRHIQMMIGAFPARGMIRAWLKAGVVEQGRLHRTEDGVPQGGVVSPLLLNVALHGMEMAAGVRYHQTGNNAGNAVMGSPVLIRYADDFVAALPHQAGSARGQSAARSVAGAQRSGVQRGQDARRHPRGGVGSSRGAVPALPPVRFPDPPAEPDVPIPEHPALHRTRDGRS